jgi:predicted dinucleotide-binding enzyme
MRKISVFGTGLVGKTIGTKLIRVGYEVIMGSRIATNENAIAWVDANGKSADVIKTLNIVNCEVMVDPAKCGGDPTMFVSGNNGDAKGKTKAILNQFGWKDIIDLGDITTARGTKMLLPIWLRTYMTTGNGYFAFKILR